MQRPRPREAGPAVLFVLYFVGGEMSSKWFIWGAIYCIFFWGGAIFYIVFVIWSGKWNQRKSKWPLRRTAALSGPVVSFHTLCYFVCCFLSYIHCLLGLGPYFAQNWASISANLRPAWSRTSRSSSVICVIYCICTIVRIVIVLCVYIYIYIYSIAFVLYILISQLITQIRLEKRAQQCPRAERKGMGNWSTR